MPDLDPSLWIFFGTVVGTVGLRWLDHWLTRRKTTLDEGAAWRKELREELGIQKQEIDQLEAQVEHWRSLYYDLKEAYTLLKVQLEFALAKIRDEAARAESILPDPKELPPDGSDPQRGVDK